MADAGSRMAWSKSNSEATGDCHGHGAEENRDILNLISRRARKARERPDIPRLT